MQEKDDILCDIKQKSIDMLNAYGYDFGRLEIDIDCSKKRANVKLKQTERKNGKIITTTENLT